MRTIRTFLLVLFCLFSAQVDRLAAAIMPIEPMQPTTSISKIEQQAQTFAKSAREHRKELRKELRQQRPNGDDKKILCVILAIFIPFLGVGIWSGINMDFWITLLLTFLFFLPGLIYALYVILAK